MRRKLSETDEPGSVFNSMRAGEIVRAEAYVNPLITEISVIKEIFFIPLKKFDICEFE